MYSILYANYTSEKFKKNMGWQFCFLEKLVTFLLESLLFLAESETDRFLWCSVDISREIVGIPGQMKHAFVSVQGRG